jgi:hypothetical protein
MSWTDVVPFLSRDHLADAQKGITAEERAAHENLFRVKRVRNRQRGKRQVVTVSIQNKENLLELLDRFSELPKDFPEVAFRASVPANVTIQSGALLKSNWEIHEMRTELQTPGLLKLWHLLAFSERGKWITPMDASRLDQVASHLARTRSLLTANLGMWRIPRELSSENRPAQYLPVSIYEMGIKGGIPVREWLEALLWHTLRGSFQTNYMIPGCGEVPIESSNWPGDFFGEWLLLCVFPYLTRRGILTFLPFTWASPFTTLDIEYTVWSNSQSECVFFPASGECC